MLFRWSKKYNILFVVSLLIFIDAIGIGLILPMMPRLFFSKNIGLGMSIPPGTLNFFYGLTIAIFPLLAMIGMPVFGNLSDKFGRKIVLLWGMFGLILGYLICILALIFNNIYIFLFARIISGFSSGTYAVCYAVAMDHTGNELQKIQWLKYLTLFHVAGFILGPALSSFVPDTYNSSLVLIIPFIIASAISFINFILIIFLYSDSKVIVRKPEQINSNLKQSILAITFIFRQKFGGFLYGYMLFNLGLQVYIQEQSLYLMKMYNYTTKQIGVFYIIIGISATVSMFIVHPRIRSRYNATFQVKTGMFLMGFFLLMHMFLITEVRIPLSWKVVCTWAISILVYVLDPFVALNMKRIFSDMVPNDKQGNLMGALGQIESLTTVAGTLLMSFFLYFGNNLGAGISGSILLIGFIVISFAINTFI
ncbi:MAG: hypothetical protein K0R94_292 [Burkholderiales bacterium]|nr:hypothetical protein [Burkholderiales bacterium]